MRHEACRGSKLALDIAKGLHYLHSRNIVHLDLKSPNVLLTLKKEQAKISDVGLAKFTSDGAAFATQGEMPCNSDVVLQQYVLRTGFKCLR